MNALAIFRISILVGLLLGIASVVIAQGQERPTTADQALQELKVGNDHHANHRYTHPHETPKRQHELAAGQNPHAVVLGCADSRVPPEIIFDQGLGDLFTVRVAGNVAGVNELASIEYAVEHLHSPLLVVMGHQKCGAVSAAVEGGEADGHLPDLIKAIQPAVDKAKGMPGDAIENAVRNNVEMVVKQVPSQPVLAPFVKQGKLRVVGAVYSLDTGRVTWLSDTVEFPAQKGNEVSSRPYTPATSQ
jgi:carbonic anhydrase